MSEVVDDLPEVYQALQYCLEIKFSMDSDGGILRRTANFVKSLFTPKGDEGGVILKRLPSNAYNQALHC